MTIWEQKKHFWFVFWPACLLLPLTLLSRLFVCRKELVPERSAPLHTLNILKGHLLPVPNSTRHPTARHLIIPIHRTGKYTQVNYEYHGLAQQSFNTLTLETEAASGHCFLHPNIILHTAFIVSPLLSQYVWHPSQFVDTQNHTSTCINDSLSQLTYNYINATLLIHLKSTLHQTFSNRLLFLKKIRGSVY